MSDPGCLDMAPLGALDFPPYFVDMAHPDDYTPMDEPLPVTFIFHEAGQHHRLFARLSFRLPDGQFLPRTFLVGTGAPGAFYFGERAAAALAGRRVLADDTGAAFVELPDGKQLPAAETPAPRAPANVMGMLALSHLGLSIGRDEARFQVEFAYL